MCERRAGTRVCVWREAEPVRTTAVCVFQLELCHLSVSTRFGFCLSSDSCPLIGRESPRHPQSETTRTHTHLPQKNMWRHICAPRPSFGCEDQIPFTPAPIGALTWCDVESQLSKTSLCAAVLCEANRRIILYILPWILLVNVDAADTFQWSSHRSCWEVTCSEPLLHGKMLVMGKPFQSTPPELPLEEEKEELVGWRRDGRSGDVGVIQQETAQCHSFYLEFI